MPTREVDQLIDQLIELGEDKEELEFYRETFEDLPPEGQEEILLNLKTEISELLTIS
ncbi:MAG: hypothetical protein WC654_00640 [Patescibacteria group bacterium]